MTTLAEALKRERDLDEALTGRAAELAELAARHEAFRDEDRAQTERRGAGVKAMEARQQRERDDLAKRQAADLAAQQEKAQEARQAFDKQQTEDKAEYEKRGAMSRMFGQSRADFDQQQADARKAFDQQQAQERAAFTRDQTRARSELAGLHKDEAGKLRLDAQRDQQRRDAQPGRVEAAAAVATLTTAAVVVQRMQERDENKHGDRYEQARKERGATGHDVKPADLVDAARDRDRAHELRMGGLEQQRAKQGEIGNAAGVRGVDAQIRGEQARYEADVWSDVGARAQIAKDDNTVRLAAEQEQAALGRAEQAARDWQEARAEIVQRIESTPAEAPEQAQAKAEPTQGQQTDKPTPWQDRRDELRQTPEGRAMLQQFAQEAPALAAMAARDPERAALAQQQQSEQAAELLEQQANREALLQRAAEDAAQPKATPFPVPGFGTNKTAEPVQPAPTPEPPKVEAVPQPEQPKAAPGRRRVPSMIGRADEGPEPTPAERVAAPKAEQAKAADPDRAWLAENFKTHAGLHNEAKPYATRDDVPDDVRKSAETERAKRLEAAGHTKAAADELAVNGKSAAYHALVGAAGQASAQAQEAGKTWRAFAQAEQQGQAQQKAEDRRDLVPESARKASSSNRPDLAGEQTGPQPVRQSAFARRPTVAAEQDNQQRRSAFAAPPESERAQQNRAAGLKSARLQAQEAAHDERKPSAFTPKPKAAEPEDAAPSYAPRFR